MKNVKGVCFTFSICGILETLINCYGLLTFIAFQLRLARFQGYEAFQDKLQQAEKRKKEKKKLFFCKFKGLIDGITAIVTLPQININQGSYTGLYEEHFT